MYIKLTKYIVVVDNINMDFYHYRILLHEITEGLNKMYEFPNRQEVLKKLFLTEFEFFHRNQEFYYSYFYEDNNYIFSKITKKYMDEQYDKKGELKNLIDNREIYNLIINTDSNSQYGQYIYICGLKSDFNFLIKSFNEKIQNILTSKKIGYNSSIDSVPDSKSFWNVAKSKKIHRLILEYKPPNLWGDREDEEAKILCQEFNARVISKEIINNETKLNIPENHEQLNRLLDSERGKYRTIMKGEHNKIEYDSQKVINTKKTNISSFDQNKFNSKNIEYIFEIKIKVEENYSNV